MIPRVVKMTEMSREGDRGTGATVQVRWKDQKDQDQERGETHEDLAVDLVRREGAERENVDQDQLLEEEEDHGLKTFQLLLTNYTLLGSNICFCLVL